MEELKSQHEEFLIKVYRHIEENIDKESYSVEDLAEHVGLSRSMLHRKLKKLTGKSPGDLITFKRLEKAREMLEKDVGTVSEIAYRVGFNSPSYFNKVFKKHFKVSPGDVKKQPGKYAYHSIKPKTKYMYILKKWRKYAWMLLVAGNVLLIYIIINSWNAIPFSEKDWIIVTDFENLTGDTLLDKSLNRALEISLQQSSYVNIYPRSRIHEVLERMEIEKSVLVNESIGMEIAKREGIKVIVVCSVSEVGGVYTLGSKIIEVKSGQTLRSQTFQAQGMDKILNNLDKLGKKLRRDLGESLQNINYDSVPLPEATTSSLEALDYFVKAGSAWIDEGKVDEAESLYLEALKLDPDFALAHADLGALYYWTNNRENGEEQFKRALELFDRLTEKEKMVIEANIERYRGNHDGAIIKYGALLKKYPDLLSAWFSLGYSYMMLGQHQKAIDAYQSSLAIFEDENANTFINIATCYSSLQEYSKALEYYLRAFELNPALLKISNINHEFGINYIGMGEYEKAMAVYDKMSSTEDEQAFSLRSKALLNMYRGQYSEAIENLNESCMLYKTLEYDLSRYRNLMYIAKACQAKGRSVELQKTLDKANEILKKHSFSPGWLVYYGKLSLKTDRNFKADSLLEKMKARINEGNRFDESSFLLMLGEMELMAGNYEVAEESFKTAVNLHKTGYSLESLAHYYFETGEYDQAKEKYLEIIERKDIGWEAQPCYLEAHYQLGKLYEITGDTLNALKYYKILAEHWKDADEDVVMLVDVKKRLEELEG